MTARENEDVSTTFYEEIGGEETFRRIVAKFYEGVAGDVVLRPLYPEEDLAPSEALKRRLPDLHIMREPLAPREWAALAGWTDAVVGMRLHSLIFAASRAVPVIGISYDPKVDALLARLRAVPAGTADSLVPEKVRTSVLSALEKDEDRRRDREARAEHLRAAAARNVDRALELLR